MERVSWCFQKQSGKALTLNNNNLTQPMVNRLKLLGITYLIGKISRLNFIFHGPKWLSKQCGPGHQKASVFSWDGIFSVPLKGISGSFKSGRCGGKFPSMHVFQRFLEEGLTSLNVQSSKTRAFFFMQDVAVVPYQLLFSVLSSHFFSKNPIHLAFKNHLFCLIRGAIFQEACFLGGTEGLEAWKNYRQGTVPGHRDRGFWRHFWTFFPPLPLRFQSHPCFFLLERSKTTTGRL